MPEMYLGSLASLKISFLFIIQNPASVLPEDDIYWLYFVATHVKTLYVEIPVAQITILL